MSFYVDIVAMVFGMPPRCSRDRGRPCSGRPEDAATTAGPATPHRRSARCSSGILSAAAASRTPARGSRWCCRSSRGGSRSPGPIRSGLRRWLACSCSRSREPPTTSARFPVDDAAVRLARRVPRTAAGRLHGRRRGRSAAGDVEPAPSPALFGLGGQRRRRVRGAHGCVRRCRAQVAQVQHPAPPPPSAVGIARGCARLEEERRGGRAGGCGCVPDRAGGAARGVVERIRGDVHAAVPGLGETISYGIPTFTRDGAARGGVDGARLGVSGAGQATPR